MRTLIQTPTSNLNDSLDFYSRIGFSQVKDHDRNIISDGKVAIEINSDRYARAGIKLSNANWDGILVELKKITSVLEHEGSHILCDPSGTWIYLIKSKENDDIDLNQYSPSVLGNFAGVSLETISIEQSSKLWQILGFSISMGSVDQGWVSLSNDDGMTVSLMKPLSCPHLFFNPGLTYFNGGNNPEIIAKIRELNIPITEEITFFNTDGNVDNIIIRDPAGLGFFLFND